MKLAIAEKESRALLPVHFVMATPVMAAPHDAAGA